MLILITAFFIIFGYYNQLSLQQEKQYDRLMAIVASTATQLNGDTFDKLCSQYQFKDDIQEINQSVDYKSLHNTLSRAQLNNNLNSPLLTMVYEESKDVFNYVVRSDSQVYYRHEYVEYPSVLFEKMKEGGILPKYKSENGTWLSAFYPIKSSTGKVVGVLESDLEFSQFSSIVNARYARQALIALIVIIVFALILIPYTLKVLRHDALQNKKIRDQADLINEKNKDITDSINYAKRIQEAILPSNIQVSKQFNDNFIIYVPKDIVAGDFYWLQKHGDIDLLAVCDCTGHGVPGAMVSVVCNNALNRAVREFDLTAPNKILDKTTEIVTRSFEVDGKAIKDGMDISLCALNRKTNELLYSGANNDLIIIRDGEILKLKASRQPVGFYEYYKPFESTSHKLKKGDQVYLFSDGYPDQFGGLKGKKFKSANFEALLLRVSTLSIIEQKETLIKEFNNWKGEYEQLDDVCVVGFRF